MSNRVRNWERLRSIKTIEELLGYLREELDWPIDGQGVEDVAFEYAPEELGLDSRYAAKIDSIHRLRPMSVKQPWGIFFVDFEPKNLPVTALRRILSQVALKKRAKGAHQAWKQDDLLFISTYGDSHSRSICLAHFGQPEGQDLPPLRVLGWDGLDTGLHVQHAAQVLVERLKWPEDENNLEAWRSGWSSAFTVGHRETIRTAKDMALRLAELARAIRDRLLHLLDMENEQGPFHQLLEAFRSSLVHDLTAAGFADMYAQTIAYGLLSARITDPSRRTADDFADHLRTNPFLRELLGSFLKAGGRGAEGGPGLDFDELGVAEVVALLDAAKMEEVVRDFGDRNPQEDPVIHFYEHFLAAYDKKQKVSRGVFYTPRPVVSYIVRSVDELLRTEFSLEDGLADTTTWGEMLKRQPDLQLPNLSEDLAHPRLLDPAHPFVQILDPATGTGTFLVEVIEIIHQTMTNKWKAQGKTATQIDVLWNDYVPRHLLPRLHGYELLMAPYAIAHLKIGLKLHETGYRFGSEERACIFLTNALEPSNDKQITTAMLPALAHEAQAVNQIKRRQRFTVVFGNPPYSGVSSNVGNWIEKLLRSPLHDGGTSYFQFNGMPLDEPNTRWLNDDYVKFLRLVQAEVAKSKVGIASLITNHSWLENPTFRGMRQSVTRTFPQVFLLDLHGNAKKKETAPDGSKDENVFDIQQGVAISLLVSRSREQSIRHADIFGVRTEKYQELQRTSVSTTVWHVLSPDPALMLWRRFDATNADEYESFSVITDIISSGGVDGRGNSWAKGLATTKDHLYISFDRDEAHEKIGLLASHDVSDSRVSETLSLEDTPYFKIENARRAIRRGDWKSRLCEVSYRPFDTRVLYWHPELYDVGRGASSKRVMSHMFKQNIALVTSRMTKGESFAHTFVSRFPVEVIFLSSKTSNNAFVFPLRCYSDMKSQFGLELDHNHFSTNISPNFLRRLAQNLGLDITKNGLPVNLTPEDIFQYAYAVFHSPSYRSRFAEFLKIDFPRLPHTGNLELFRTLVSLGGELVALHLLESPKLDAFISTYSGPPQPEVGRVGWSDGTVWLDAAATKKGQPATPGSVGFHGVPEEVWNFHIGGYQVCEKWLKDRKGRRLSDEDIVHYQKIVVALAETIRLMGEIDEVIEKHGGWPGAFATGPAVSSADYPDDAEDLPKAAETGDLFGADPVG